MSKLTEALEAIKQPVKPELEKWIESLDKEDHAALLEAAVDVSIPSVRLREIIEANGGKVSRDKLSAWRRSHGLNR